MSDPMVWRFEMPFAAEPPRLAGRDGSPIARVLRSGDSYDMDVTILDAPDHRLLRSGVTVAHRILDGVGQWYLAAAGWEPWLPTEDVRWLGDAELPEDFADLIRPFRRRAMLAPVASLHCERRRYATRAGDGRILARIRDDAVTIRRGGLTTARYRELEVECAGDFACERAIGDAFTEAGATAVAGFPSLTDRLGAPATGMSDYPPARRWSDGVTMEGFVAGLLARRLRRLFAADLARRSGQASSDDFRRTLETMRADVRGLAGALDIPWARGLIDDINALLELDAAEALRDDRYFDILDRLVAANRAPRLGDHARRDAAETVASERAESLDALLVSAKTLDPDAADDAWHDVCAAAEHAADVARLGRLLHGKPAAALARRLARAAAALDACCAVTSAPPPGAVDDLDPQAAFEAGRVFERDVAAQRVARTQFCDGWRKRRRQIRKAAKGAR